MFRGAVVALVTPFDLEGEVDYTRLAELLEWHVSEGIDAIMLCGSTGESPTLTEEEHEKIFRLGMEVVQKRVPLIFGTGTNDTRKTVKRTELAKQIGADAVLVVVPYYNRPTPEGCVAHFAEVSKVGVPVIVYHHPGRTGVRLEEPILRQLSQIPHIAAVKDSTGDLELLKKMQGISFFSGDDPLTLPTLELGGLGILSIVANLIPREWSAMTRAFFEGNKPKAYEIFHRFSKLAEAMVIESNPGPVKYALSLLGKCSARLRLPLVEPRLESKLQIHAAMQEAFHPLSLTT